MQEEKASGGLGFGKWWNEQTHQKQTALAVLAGSAILVIVIAVLSFRNNVYAPFLRPVSEIEQKKELLKDPTAEQEKLKKRIDTDGDGLSDWMEENIYKTSPYLWSTAGDNVPDNVKLARGENPLCHEGADCAPPDMKLDLPTSTGFYDQLVQTQKTEALWQNVLNSNNSTITDYKQQAGLTTENIASSIPRDPATLRQALLDSGKVTQAELDKITDDQLLQMFDEAMQETTSSTNANTTTTNTTN